MLFYLIDNQVLKLLAVKITGWKRAFPLLKQCSADVISELSVFSILALKLYHNGHTVPAHLKGNGWLPAWDEDK